MSYELASGTFVARGHRSVMELPKQLWLALAILLITLPPVAEARWDLVGITGDSIVNGKLDTFGNPIIGDRGTVVFTATLSGVSAVGSTPATALDSGLFMGTPGILAPQLVVRENDPIPTTSGLPAGRFSTFGSVRMFDPIVGEFPSLGPPPRIDFFSGLTGTSITEANNKGVFSYSPETPSSLTAFLREGQNIAGSIVASPLADQTPQGGGNTLIPRLTDGSSTIYGTFTPSFYFSGDLLAAATSSTLDSSRMGLAYLVRTLGLAGVEDTLWYSLPGDTDTLADGFTSSGNRIVPVASGAQFAGSSLSFRGLMNNSGQLVYETRFAPGPVTDATPFSSYTFSNIYVATEIPDSPIQSRLVAGTGSPAPGGGTFARLMATAFNDAGQTAFLASMSGVSPLNDLGLFRDDNGTLKTIVREGQILNLSDSTSSRQYEVTDIGLGSMNQSGILSFQATLITDGFQTSGILLSDGRDIVLVAGGLGGEIASRGTDAYVTTAPDSYAPGTSLTQQIGDSWTNQINEYGQVAYRALSATSRSNPSLAGQAIVVATPDLHFRGSSTNASGGDWLTPDNWTLGLKPSDVHDVYIDPKSEAVTVEIDSLDLALAKTVTVGGGAAQGILTIAEGSLLGGQDMTRSSQFVLPALENFKVVTNGLALNEGEIHTRTIQVHGGNLTNAGALTVATSLDMPELSGSPWLTIESGGHFTQQSELGIGAFDRPIVNNAELEIMNGSVVGSALMGGGQVTITGGTLSVNSGPLSGIAISGGGYFSNTTTMPSLGLAGLQATGGVIWFEQATFADPASNFSSPGYLPLMGKFSYLILKNITFESGTANFKGFNVDATFSGGSSLLSFATAPGALELFGKLKLRDGALLAFEDTQNFAAIDVTLLESGALDGAGTVVAKLQNRGNIDAKGMLVFSGSLNNRGFMQASLNDAFAVVGRTDNNGTIEMIESSFTGSTEGANGVITSGAGIFANNANGIVRGTGRVQAATTNRGLIHATRPLSVTVDSTDNPDGQVVTVELSNAAPLSFTGSFSNSGGGELRVDPGATLNVNSSFTNRGSIQLRGTDATFTGGTITNTGTLYGSGRVAAKVTNTTGTVRAESGQLTLAATGNTNAAGGRLEVLSGATMFFTEGLATNNGLIEIKSGTFDNNRWTLTNNGSIKGSGVLRYGSLINNGTIDTGFSPGHLEIFSDLVQGADGTMKVEIAGMVPGDEHGFDLIEVIDGSVSLDGTLNVSLIGGFLPTVGDVFEFLHASGGITGMFAHVNLPYFKGARFVLDYGPNALSLRAAAPVPLPSALPLAIAALIALARVGRRRRAAVS